MITFKQLLEKKMKGEDPCWDDYEMVGMKEKNGKKVPNCVPKQEGYVSDAQRKAVWAARNEKGVKEEVELEEGQVTSKELDSGAHDVFYNGKHIGTVHSKKVQWFGGKSTNKISAKYHDGEKVDVNPDNKGRTTLDSAKASLVYHHLRKSKSMKEEVEINEAKIPVEHAVKAVTRVLGSQSAARFATHLKPGTEKHTSWDKVNDALKKQGVKPKHIADIAVHVRPAQYEEVELEEAISIEHDRYMRSHGKKASGTGTWMFTHKRAGDVDYKNDKEVHQARGSFSDAAKSAKAWAKSHGHSTVYVMEEVELDEASDTKRPPNFTMYPIDRQDYKILRDPKKKPLPKDSKEWGRDGGEKKMKEEVELEEAAFAPTMKKAIAAHERGDATKAKYHLDNAKTARYAMKSTEISKHKELLDKYEELRDKYVSEEQGVAEAAKWRRDDLEGKTWRGSDWDDGELSPDKIQIDRSGKDVHDSGDELKSRPSAWRGKADMAKRMTKKGTPTKSELAFQNNLKMRMRMKKKEGGLTGPQGTLPEEVELDESGFADDFLKMVQKRHPQAKLTTGAEKKKEAEDLMKKRVASGAKPVYPHPGPDKHPLGGYDPVSKRSYSEEVEQVDEISTELKQKYLGAATKKHLQQFLGRAPVRGKQELDKRRAAIQKTSKELTGKTHYREEVDQKMLSFGEFITK